MTEIRSSKIRTKLRGKFRFGTKDEVENQSSAHALNLLATERHYSAQSELI